MSPHWAASEWAGYESILTRSADPTGTKVRTIPLLYQECEIPEELALLTYIDFTRPDRLDHAWHQLFTVLNAGGEPPAAERGARDGWLLAHPYAMPPNFTGRAAERAMLTQWLTGDARHPVLVLRALGGFGKSALAWHWLLHDVPPAWWRRVVWWSFYESDATFDGLLTACVGLLAGDADAVRSAPPRERVDRLLKALTLPGTLLILDGFERNLRAFAGLASAYRGDEMAAESRARECVSPLAEVFLRALATLPGAAASCCRGARKSSCSSSARKTP
jgi:hypothetical protein